MNCPTCHKPVKEHERGQSLNDCITAIRFPVPLCEQLHPTDEFPPCPSTSPSLDPAWELVKEMMGMGLEVELSLKGDMYRCRIDKYYREEGNNQVRQVGGVSDNIQESICLAYLKVMAVKEGGSEGICPTGL